MDIHAWLHGTEDRRPPPDERFLLRRTLSPSSPELDLDVQKERKRARERRDTLRRGRRTSRALRDDQFPQDNVYPVPEDLGNEWMVSEEEDAASTSSAKYRKRRRRKTRADRYELKTLKPKKRAQHAEKHVPVRRTRRTDSTAANGVVRAFELNARSKQRRLTLEPVQRMGLFMHGRSAKCSANSKGLPDLSFTGLGFLQRKKQQNVNDTREADELPDDRRNENVKISEYFQAKPNQSTDEIVSPAHNVLSPNPLRSRTSIMLSQIARNGDMFFGRGDLDGHGGAHTADRISPSKEDPDHHDIAHTMVQGGLDREVDMAAPAHSTSTSLPGQLAAGAGTADFRYPAYNLATSSGQSQRRQHTSNKPQRRPLQALQASHQRNNQLPDSESPLQPSRQGLFPQTTLVRTSSSLLHRVQPARHSEASRLPSPKGTRRAVHAGDPWVGPIPQIRDTMLLDEAVSQHTSNFTIPGTRAPSAGQQERLKQTDHPKLPTRQLRAFGPGVTHVATIPTVAELQASASNTMLWHHAAPEAEAPEQYWLPGRHHYVFDGLLPTSTRSENPQATSVDFTSGETHGGIYQDGMDHVSTGKPSIDAMTSLAPRGFWRPNKLY